MKVLMFSLEKKLLAPAVGDLEASNELDRHVAYSETVEKLTILVAAKGAFRHQYVSPHLEAYPTQAGPLFSFFVLKNYTKNILDHEEVDLIVAQDILSFYAFLIAKRFRKPYFVTVHGAWWDLDKPFRAWWQKRAMFLNGFAIKRANGIRVVSESLKKQLVGIGADPKKISVIPPPVDFQSIILPKKSEIASLSQQYHNHDIVLYDGRLVQEKNVLFLLEVARRVSQPRPSAKLVMVGKGDLLGKLTEQAKNMGIWGKSVEIVEDLIDHVPEYYSIAKVLVMPSISESFGKGIVKASYMGLPVVAIRNLGSMTTVVDKKTGYLIERGDTEGFVKRIVYLLEHEEKRVAMGESGRKFVTKEFDYTTNLLAIQEAWKSCVRRFRNR